MALTTAFQKRVPPGASYPYIPWQWANSVSTDDRIVLVHLGESQIDPQWLHRLRHFPRLKQVSLTGGQLCSELDLLRPLPIKEIVVQGMVAESDLGHLRNLPHLSSLKVVAPPASGGGWKNLAAATSLRDVEVIDAADSRDLFQQLGEVPQLEFLAVELVEGLVSEDDLAALARLANLQFLAFPGHGVDPRALKHIARLTSLTFLDLGPCHATTRELEPLGKLPNLQTAIVNGSPLDLEALREAAAK